MSRIVESWEGSAEIDFEIGDVVEFDDPTGTTRVVGIIVREYNTRDDYHASNGSDRYSINRYVDNIVLLNRPVKKEN